MLDKIKAHSGALLDETLGLLITATIGSKPHKHNNSYRLTLHKSSRTLRPSRHLQQLQRQEVHRSARSGTCGNFEGVGNFGALLGQIQTNSVKVSRLDGAGDGTRPATIQLRQTHEFNQSRGYDEHGRSSVHQELARRNHSWGFGVVSCNVHREQLHHVRTMLRLEFAHEFRLPVVSDVGVGHRGARRVHFRHRVHSPSRNIANQARGVNFS